MASELDLIVAGVTGAMTGGLVRPVLAPVDAVSEVWKEQIKARLIQTMERVKRKRPSGDWEVTERTAVNALAAAALTDNDVAQEYLAGVIAAATAERDNSDWLALISRLTPLQLRLHYGLYLGSISFLLSILRQDGRSAYASDLIDIWANSNMFATLITDPGLPRGSHWGGVEPALEQLVREELIRVDNAYWDVTEQWVVTYQLTTYGAAFFATALGLQVVDIGGFCDVSPERLMLVPPIAPMPTRYFESFSQFVATGQGIDFLAGVWEEVVDED